MHQTRTYKSGLTLVELLVVMVLVALLAGIAIPTFIRVSALARDDLRASSVDLQEMLRATKLYAITFHTDAALAYIVNESVDSGAGESITFIDGLFMVRRINQEELNRVDPAIRSQDLYVPVNNDHGNIRKFRGDGVLMHTQPVSYGDVTGVLPRDLYAEDTGSRTPQERLGVTAIRVVDSDGNLIVPSPRPGFPVRTAETFPAHQFQSNGIMLTNAEKQRFVLPITLSPTDDPGDRYVEVTEAGDQVLQHYPIELFATLGRVKLNPPLES